MYIITWIYGMSNNDENYLKNNEWIVIVEIAIILIVRYSVLSFCFSAT